jgi:hypothetical protein
MNARMVSIENLWPTKVGTYETDPLIGAQWAAILAASGMDGEQFLNENEAYREDLMLVMKDYSLNRFDVQLIEAWTRRLDASQENSFELHSDSHYGGTHVLVFWMSGEEDVGGDLVLFDPAWRNPQVPMDRKQPHANAKTIKFKPGRMVIFPADVWHSVTKYSGSVRYGLNVIFRLTPQY